MKPYLVDYVKFTGSYVRRRTAKYGHAGDGAGVDEGVRGSPRTDEEGGPTLDVVSLPFVGRGLPKETNQV